MTLAHELGTDARARGALVGEGRLTLADRLCGKRVLAPVLVALLAVALLSWLYGSGASEHAPWWRWLPFVAGAAVPLWFGHRAGLWRIVLLLLRGTPAPAWRVELDDHGVRQTNLDGRDHHDYAWAQLRGFGRTELGLVLWLLVPRDDATVILLPRRFFPTEQWEPVVALVRSKFPAQAEVWDAASAAAKLARRAALRRTVLLWLALVGALTIVWALLGRGR